MAGPGRNLAGVRGLSDSEHQKQIQKYGETEGDKGISPRRFWSRGKTRNGPATRIGGSGCSYTFGEQLSARENKRNRRKRFGGFADLDRSSARVRTHLNDCKTRTPWPWLSGARRRDLDSSKARVLSRQWPRDCKLGCGEGLEAL